MKLSTNLLGKNYTFGSLREVMAKANEPKSGDCLAGVAAESAIERVAAKQVLSELTVKEISENPAVAYEKDAVTRIIWDNLDMLQYSKIKNFTIGQLREWLLDHQVSGDDMLLAGRGMTSEVIAAVAKLMGNLDLVYASQKMQIYATCNTTIGGPGILASRLQPNHPYDDPDGIEASLLEGLSYGVGDAVLGVNPAIDSVESTCAVWDRLMDIRQRYEIPTQTCVLSHVTTQMKALEAGHKADLCFQSISGSEAGLREFGVTTEILAEANEMFHKDGASKGENVMYFETGQGSALSSSTHNGWDQLTMECRCYGLARHYQPFLVNTVVGFIGPEYLYDARQLLRAGLEDVFCGHLHGLPMGCDVCYTNHMVTDQNDLESLGIMLTSAGCHYFMGIPQGDDIMLMYQSSGFHDIAALRELSGKRPIKEFEQWLESREILCDGRLGKHAGDPTMFVKKEESYDTTGLRKYI